MDFQPEGSDGGENGFANKAYLLALNSDQERLFACLGGTPGWSKNATAQSETHKECIKKIPGATCGFSAGGKRRWRKWLSK